jgi:hypothetical protein
MGSEVQGRIGLNSTQQGSAVQGWSGLGRVVRTLKFVCPSLPFDVDETFLTLLVAAVETAAVLVAAVETGVVLVAAVETAAVLVAAVETGVVLVVAVETAAVLVAAVETAVELAPAIISLYEVH